MPKIYEYLGIVILFYSDEHRPIHIHAIYGNNEMKVSFFIKNGKIYRVTYKELGGKFSNKKLKQLKKFISEYKYEIVKKWQDFFIWGKDLDFERITKNI